MMSAKTMRPVLLINVPLQHASSAAAANRFSGSADVNATVGAESGTLGGRLALATGS